METAGENRTHIGFFRREEQIHFATAANKMPALTQLVRDEHDVQIMFVCI